MSKKRLSFRRLFSNTKFLVVFSIVVAFVFWIAVALEYAPIIDREFENVPVTVDLDNSVPEKFGLQMFNNQNFTVDITVRGSRYIIGGDLMSADDFDISVQTAYVNSTGNHTLQISVTPKDSNADFEIVSFYPEYIEAYFDKYDEKEIKVEPRIVTELSQIVDDSYIANVEDVIISQKTVKISGPKTEIDKVENAYADIQIDNKLTQNLSLDAPISLECGSEEVKFVTASAGGKETIPVTLPVYKIENLTSAVNFKNIPSEYIDSPLECSYSVESFKAGIVQDGEMDASSFTLGTIDFKNISEKNNSFTFKTKDIENIKVLDKTDTVTVKINMDGFTSSKLSASDSNFVFTRNDKNSFAFNPSAVGSITVVGPQASVSKLDSSNLVISVDSAKLEDGNTSGEIPVDITLKNADDCWVYGDYSINIIKK